MKVKGILALGSCLLILSGCQGVKEKPESKLALLNCAELQEFHQSTKNDLNESTQNRETANNINIAIGVLSMAAGSGSFMTQGTSTEERQLKLELAAIESVARDKNCEIVTVAAVDSTDKVAQ